LPGIPTEFWVPVTMVESFVFSGVQWQADQDPGSSRLDRRGTRWLFVKGRLADGRTLEQARAQVETIFARLSATYPVTNDKVTASVLPATASFENHWLRYPGSHRAGGKTAPNPSTGCPFGFDCVSSTSSDTLRFRRRVYSIGSYEGIDRTLSGSRWNPNVIAFVSFTARLRSHGTRLRDGRSTWYYCIATEGLPWLR
jgi:hypothetical protein